MKIFFWSLVASVVLTLGYANSISAADGTTVNVTSAPQTTINLVGSEGGAKLENPLNCNADNKSEGCNNLSDFVAAVLKAAVEVLMPFVVLAFIWSGFLFVRAQGNEEMLGEAKTAIYYSVLGAFILLGAWGFAEIIASTVGSITGVQPN